MQCAQLQGDPAAEWKAANGDAAWNTTTASWRQLQSKGKAFPRFVSEFLHGPDGMRCSDFATENRCAMPVECQNNIIPAGSVILNGFVAIHQLHASNYQGIDSLEADLTAEVGTFRDTFAPEEQDESKAKKNIFDSIMLVLMLGESLIFSAGMLQAPPPPPVQSCRLSLSTHSADLTMYSAVEGLKVQNDISSYLGQTMLAWKGLESQYLQSIFSGSDDSNKKLYDIIHHGVQQDPINTLDLNKTMGEMKKAIYGQMIPYAWSVAPGDKRPFIWRTIYDCDENTKDIPEEYNSPLDQKFAVDTNVCHDGKIHYLLAAYNKDMSNYGLDRLPGGVHSTLDGSRWGGLTLEQIVASSIAGWKNNNQKNGYPRPNMDDIIGKFGKEKVDLSMAGFFNFPICTGLYRRGIEDVISRGNPDDPSWPCDSAEGYSSSGTNINIARGCIVINDSKRCAQGTGGAYNVADQSKEKNTATIYAGFDGDDHIHDRVTPPCKLNAEWPRNWGDLDFDNNCLKSRDESYELCCSDKTKTSDVVINPYVPQD
ncbi:uncharacterized protein BDW47DRAFT_133202 [Aspergillus candidus]|uniref:Uncharacterized protein n=1 Tax=Aspergillus candidus TaxID=41067 RepID=A0A2I2F5N0_ASPCN|nr:hypothetical protein BDW47DRAFT_133202 [Aspergillus candidus]PLB35969.1 hypothetical protein BDW47DRAFT_133202 [Aspergillus candidus]